MSRSTRCRLCGHTPGAWDPTERKQPGPKGREPAEACIHGCVCHDEAPIAREYGPSPATRPGWPRANPTHQMPLVPRTYPVHPTGNDFWNYQDKGTGREFNPYAGLFTRGRNA